MHGDAVEAIRGLAERAAGKTVDVGGVTYSTTPLHDVRKPEPEPAPLKVHTLSGFIDYIERNLDGLQLVDCLVHVETPVAVSLVGPLTGRFQQRNEYLLAEALPRLEGFKFGDWMDLERMNIALQALFAPTPDRDRALRLVGTVKDEGVRTSADDGVTQTVTAKSGLTVLAETTVPNPVELAPFRTFPEIEQPASPFILRLKQGTGGVVAALFEADGGAWRNTAITAIAKYLGEHLPGEGLRPHLIG